MTITINGEPCEVPPGTRVPALLEMHGLNAGRVAIERNMEILPREQWAVTEVTAGDRYEIVHFVGGG